MFKAFVLPIIEYGAKIWNQNCITYKLNDNIDECLRIATRIALSLHVSPLHPRHTKFFYARTKTRNCSYYHFVKNLSWRIILAYIVAHNPKHDQCHFALDQKAKPCLQFTQALQFQISGRHFSSMFEWPGKTRGILFNQFLRFEDKIDKRHT